MPAQELQSLLQRLHAELSRSPNVDDESRRLLAVVVADIERLGSGGAATTGGVEALAVRFEADHPAVAGALRQIGDLLGKAGI